MPYCFAIVIWFFNVLVLYFALCFVVVAGVGQTFNRCNPGGQGRNITIHKNFILIL